MKSFVRPLTLALLLLVAAAGAAKAAPAPVKIAFVDTGATGRSVAAEALATAAARRDGLPVLVIARAADLDPFETTPEPEIARLLARRGLDVSAHRAQALTAEDVRPATVIVTMTARHRAQILERFPDAAAKTFVLARYAADEPLDIADAKDGTPEVYRAMLAQLDRYVPLALARALATRP